MNSIDDQLNRLFRAAGRGQPDQSFVAPYGLETRAMAAWRRATLAGTGFWDMTLLVRGLILASLIMAVSFWPALTSTESTTNPFAEYLQLTDTTISTDNTP